MGEKIALKHARQYRRTAWPFLHWSERFPRYSRSPALTAWPEPKPSWQSEYLQRTVAAPHRGDRWHENARERARALAEDSARAVRDEAARAAEREKRESAAVKPAALAAQTAGSPHGPWRLSNSPALTFALPNAFFTSLGFAPFAVPKAP